MLDRKQFRFRELKKYRILEKKTQWVDDSTKSVYQTQRKILGIWLYMMGRENPIIPYSAYAYILPIFAFSLIMSFVTFKAFFIIIMILIAIISLVIVSELGRKEFSSYKEAADFIEDRVKTKRVAYLRGQHQKKAKISKTTKTVVHNLDIRITRREKLNRLNRI